MWETKKEETPYARVVKYIAKANYVPQTAKDIATNLELQTRSVNGILTSMQKKGYIKRTLIGNKKFIEPTGPMYPAIIELIEKGLG